MSIIIIIPEQMQSSCIKKIEGFKVYMGKLLGKGAFGSVYEGSNQQTKQKVAVKILPKSKIDSDPYLKSALISEIKIMRTVSSDNVVRLYDVLESKNNYYIVQELCSDGNLQEKIRERRREGKKFSQVEAKEMLFQMANGFLILVKEGIIHRDFKPANVMIKGKQLKIGDFGFAKKAITPQNMSAQTIVGTPLYMSLQVLKSQSYSSKCDVWALALLYYELLHMKTPWGGKSEYDLVQNIINQELKIDDNLSQVTKDFLRKSLEIRQDKRLCWDQVFVHPIFQKKFHSLATVNNQFEDKLKVVMSELRFEINANNLDLEKILTAFGYKEKKNQLNQQEFYELLKVIYPPITRAQSDYIFKKTDLNQNGMISLEQIQILMGSHQISLHSVYKKVPLPKPNRTTDSQSIETSADFDPKQCQEKATHLFKNLKFYLDKQRLHFYHVFMKYSNGKNALTKQQFTIFMNDLSNELKGQQINYIFSLLDYNKSNKVEFDEMNKYFSKINNIPLYYNQPAYPQHYMPQMMTNNVFQYGSYLYSHPHPMPVTMQPAYGYPQYYPAQQQRQDEPKSSGQAYIRQKIAKSKQSQNKSDK